MIRVCTLTKLRCIDGSSLMTIALEDIDTLYGLRQDSGNEFISIKDDVEELCWWDWGGVIVSDGFHDIFEKLKNKRTREEEIKFSFNMWKDVLVQDGLGSLG